MQLDKILDAAVAAVEADEPICAPSLTQHKSSQSSPRSMPYISETFSVPSDLLDEELNVKQQNNTPDGYTTMTDNPDFLSHPIEVSFFNMEDEGLVITSEQVMGMFESEPDRDEVSEVKIDETMTESDYAVNVQSTSQVSSCVENSVELMDVSSEIEVSTTENSDIPEYTVLTPPDSEYSFVPSCGTEPIDICPDNVSFDAPLGSTVNATVDADGKFLVQVVAPGINMTIPNHYINQNQSKISDVDASLQNITEDDVFEAFDLAFDGETPHISTTGNQTSSESEELFQHHSIEEETPKKTHSDVIAALRESIFRSKARKMVNQAEKECEPIAENMSNQTDAGPTSTETNQETSLCSCTDCVTEITDDSYPKDCNYESNSCSCQSKSSQAANRQYCHCPDCVTPRSSGCSAPCCISSSKVSCQACDGEKGDENEPLVIRPEDLASLLKRNYGKNNKLPFVMMPPNDTADTDGDSLKVQVVYLVYPSKEKQQEPRSSQYNQNNDFQQDESFRAYDCRGPSGSCLRRYPTPSGADKPALFDYPPHSLGHHHQTPIENNRFHRHSHLNNDFSHQHSKSHSHHTKVDPFDMPDNDTQANYRKNYQTPSGTQKTVFLDTLPSRTTSKTDDDSVFSLSNLEQLDVSPVDSINSQFNAGFKYNEFEPSISHVYPDHEASENTSCLQRCHKSDRPYSSHGNHQRPFCSSRMPHATEKSEAPYHNHQTHHVKSTQSSCQSHATPTITDETAADAASDSLNPPTRRGPGRPRKPENERKRKAAKSIPLWKFLLNMLHDPNTCPELVRWEDTNEGTFRIVRSEVVAAKWGMRKHNTKMTYEKFSRAMRYYYKQKIFEAVPGKRLVYKFGLAAKNWRPKNLDNPNFDKDI